MGNVLLTAWARCVCGSKDVRQWYAFEREETASSLEDCELCSADSVPLVSVNQHSTS